jgi:glutaminyl-peptide cyclotransferase
MSGTKALILLLAAIPVFADTFSGASALQFTRSAVGFGPRPVDTPAHKKLEAFITGKLRTFGCQVEQDSFTAQTPIGPKRMNNIVAKIAGQTKRVVALTGHYDTKLFDGQIFVGANDGGSSTGFLLEMARVLCGKPSKNDIYLVWLDGEEAIRNWTADDSLYGSRHLAKRWKEDGTLARVKALINVDMIGDGDLTLMHEWNSTASLRKLVWDTAASLGYSAHFPTSDGAIEDDHMPFLQAGAPALDLIDFSYGPGNSWWHTDQDTIDKLSAQSFQVVGNVLIKVLAKLEN